MKRKRGRAEFQYNGKQLYSNCLAVGGIRVDLVLLDDEDRTRRKYKKDLDLLKPDLVAYNRQKEKALGLAPGTLVKAVKPAGEDGEGSTSKEMVVSGPSSVVQRLANEDLYRDANSLIYADNKPSEEVIDKLVEKLNKEYVLLQSSLPLDPLMLTELDFVAKINETPSPVNELTKMTNLSPTSTRRTGCSIARSVLHPLIWSHGVDKTVL